ncbi:UbiA family prenyltransferase [Umezawaea endophytica]|uniref:UbiA family prenyltransferase n=1 Tax=Umezawaea endophytica TaxID=1654476 RepID=A0A9X3AFZ9_9PSEU|nr:UbiA family prenyltransferase [Umezawaea endophytica]MCS7477840.1 UbiA family prenyltransferase [Umezawaea endophytica]
MSRTPRRPIAATGPGRVTPPAAHGRTVEVDPSPAER